MATGRHGLDSWAHGSARICFSSGRLQQGAIRNWLRAAPTLVVQDTADPHPSLVPAAISPEGPKTFMDVGCNKGYTSAHFFGLWAPEVRRRRVPHPPCTPPPFTLPPPHPYLGPHRMPPPLRPSCYPFYPQVGFKPSEIPKRRPGFLCGTCADCEEEPKTKITSSTGPITVYCFEPSMRNFANLIVTRDLFFENAKPEVDW